MNENELESQYKHLICIDSIDDSFGWMSDEGEFSVYSIKGLDVERGLCHALVSMFRLNKFLYGYDLRSNQQAILNNIFDMVRQKELGQKQIRNMDLIMELRELIQDRHNAISVLNTPFNALDCQIQLRNKLKGD